MKSRLLRLTVIALVTVVALTFIYYSSIQMIEGTYQVVGVTDKGIVIQNGSEESSLRTTPDMMELIQMNHFYDIGYEKRPLQAPVIDYIRLHPAGR